MKALRGRLAVAALFWDRERVPPAVARRRLLGFWRRGCRALGFPEGLLLIFEEARHLRVEALAAEPLLAVESRLVSRLMPLAELRAFPADSLVLRRFGTKVCHLLDQGRPETPATWLDLGHAAVLEGKSLSRPPSPPTLAVAPLEGDTRSSLGVGKASPDAELLARQLRREPKLAKLWNWLGRRQGQSMPGRLSVPLPQVSPERNQLLAKLATLANVLLFAGWRHSRYLRELYKQYEEGNYDEVLRRALPIGSDRPGAAAPPLLRLPPSRQDLRIGTGANGGAALRLESLLFNDLASRYRHLASLLERRGEIEKAAFVWAELLNLPQRAIDVLEKAGLFRQAAEVAELRKLEPALVVRLYFLAGDTERALALALAHDVFAGAVLMLEQRGKMDAAAALRSAWAEKLAQSGDFLAAVRAVWPLPAERMATLPWIERALVGAYGPSRGELLIRLVQLAPQRAFEISGQWRELLAAGSESAFELRIQLATQLTAASRSKELVPLVRATLRALLQDGERPDLRRLRGELVDAAADPALREDVRRLELPPHQEKAANYPLLYRARLPRGGIEVRDWVLLPDHRMLLAAGNQGVFLVGQTGEVLHHFEVPATHLAASNHGRQAITIADSGSLHRLSRLDLENFAAEGWMEGKLEAFAESYEGQRFVIAREQTLEVLDAAAAGCRVLWRMPNLGGDVVQIACGAENICFAVAAPLRLWRLDRHLILRAKEDVEVPNEDLFSSTWAMNESGMAAFRSERVARDLRLIREEREICRFTLPEDPLDLKLFGSHLAAVGWNLKVLVCRVYSLTDPARPKEVAALEFPDSASLSCRGFGRHLVAWDDQGRWVLVDLVAARVKAEGVFSG